VTEFNDITSNQENPKDLVEVWGIEAELTVCPRCDWNFLVPKGSLPQVCPHCFGANLALVTGETDSPVQEKLPYTGSPELYLPFRLDGESLARRIEHFARSIRFAPVDLTAQNIKSRLKRIYFPMWLVDVEVQANWQAEAGFDYEVVSHQDRFDETRGGWRSQEVKENRVRWEPRLGRLRRSYQNIVAPAMEEDAKIKSELGSYNLASAKPYDREAATQAFVRLPDRSQEDSWPSAVPALQTAAAEECRQACGSEHSRDFRWSPEFLSKNWTLLLLPMFTSYYLDDDRVPQPLYIHGLTGKVSGTKRASMKRGQRAALIILGVAVGIFLLSLILAGVGFFAPPLLLIGSIGMVLAVLVGLGAILPIAIVWNFNRSQNPTSPINPNLR